MNKEDAALVSDPRTVEIADVSGMSPTEVVETAETLAVANGDTVSDELDAGAALAEEIALLDDLDSLGDDVL